MQELEYIDKSLKELLNVMNTFVSDHKDVITSLHPLQRISAINLLHYLILRNEDLRSFQDRLHNNGLSSLASSESHVMRQIQMILRRLGNEISDDELAQPDHMEGKKIISMRSREMFGSKNTSGIPFIMVTFNSEFAENYDLVRNLLLSGMNIARINTAHDDEEIWLKMIESVKKAGEETGIPCKIYMDLAGPKLRTSILGKGSKKGEVTLKEGDEIYLAENDSEYDNNSKIIGCDEPGIIKFLKVGERVLFDDGLIESKVIYSKEGIAALNIIRVSKKKPVLRSEKGINFPDSRLIIPALTDYDLSILPFVLEHSDMVGYSFVRDEKDLKLLQNKIGESKCEIPVILKIETRESVNNLPSLLMQGMKCKNFGVMIARGDLAVEIGFERMSEIQEEILWICEAAHVPVIWATQVLESQNKSGIATRSEITDAAHSIMAECVMLNKGEYILEVIKTLLNILKRSGTHHIKKRYIFRNMEIATRYLDKLDEEILQKQQILSN
ncbi:MAG: pyruvate kinase [Bacteroidetes bacterium]|nr:pyruvate kinase [Bacteroidota bacterium]